MVSLRYLLSFGSPPFTPQPQADRVTNLTPSAALDGDTDALDAFQGAELGDACAYPGRAELAHHELRDVFRERFDEQETILADAALDSRNDLGVIDRVADPVRALHPGGEPDLEIELHGLRHAALPFVYADQHLEPVILNEDRVHRMG